MLATGIHLTNKVTQAKEAKMHLSLRSLLGGGPVFWDVFYVLVGVLSVVPSRYCLTTAPASMANVQG